MSYRSHLLVAAVLLAWPVAAHADGTATDRQVAQQLFDDGRVLLEAGRHAEACPKFAESQRLDPGGGTLLNLALCHELEGKTATAWTELREALSVAGRDDRKDRQELASSHIAALGPKLIRLTVSVPRGVAAREPEITLDTSRLPPEAWNTAIPVDPGEHQIAVIPNAQRAGLSRWQTSIATLDAGRAYRVDVPALDQAGGGDVEPVETHRRSAAFWLVLGGAGAALTTSVITGLMTLEANKYVKDNCSNDRSFCRVGDAEDAASRARTLAWVSTATLVVGIGAGVLAFMLPLEKRWPLSAGVAVQDGAALASLRFTPSW